MDNDLKTRIGVALYWGGIIFFLIGLYIGGDIFVRANSSDEEFFFFSFLFLIVTYGLRYILTKKLNLLPWK
tara:strand:- start:624 stop:836 length:213 start_codon:yes stop_codon:yes gene_type:complete